ncbi:hypothetical protein N869_07270, partial [Cellulomonas bogoriensis 69B4 = DSM 16987]
MTRTIGVLLGGPAGDGAFIDAAVAAVTDARGRGIRVDLREQAPDAFDPAWGAVLCHGVQLAPWLRDLDHDRTAVPTVLTDTPADRTGLAGVTLVDWAWDQAAYCAGALAVEMAGGRGVGLVAGPPVLTQRRVASAFTAGAAARAEQVGGGELST